MRPTLTPAPRSPAIEHMMQRLAEVAPLLSANDDEPERPSLFAPYIRLFAVIGALAAYAAFLWLSVNFVLWALSLFEPGRLS